MKSSDRSFSDSKGKSNTFEERKLTGTGSYNIERAILKPSVEDDNYSDENYEDDSFESDEDDHDEEAESGGTGSGQIFQQQQITPVNSRLL
jgi:hypothetical protein